MSIKCDICGTDLTTSQCGGWRISFMVAPIPYDSGSTFDIYIPPPYKPGNYDFCGKQCMDTFLKNDKV